MLINTPIGLYCPIADFYIDPSRGVNHAVITHAHSDHARRGSKQYYSTVSGIGLLKSRLGKNINVLGFHFGHQFTIGGVRISFHPAGHILGSAQVRLEYGGEVWVASGDYKRDPDPSCEPFESVECDVFIAEATFGTPSYRWRKDADIGSEIFNWYLENSKLGLNSIVFGYSLGKTQRLLGILRSHVTKPIYTHPAAAELIQCYREQGVLLAETICLSAAEKKLSGEIIIAPQSALEKHGDVLGNYRTAFASGWMARSSYGYDKGFLLSDHADWDDLVRTVTETKAKRVYVQHRNGALVRHLKTLGIEAFPVERLVAIGNESQMSLFSDVRI